MTIQFEGGCLCEKVRYKSTAKPLATVHCYCSDCRKIGGTGHATHTVIPNDAFTFSGEISEYERIADSGNRIVRRLCPHCASAIFHTREGLEGMTVIRTSSMDEPELVKPDRAIFTDSAVSWDFIDPNLSTFGKMSPQKG
jgi:hypothetical protein